MPPGLYGKRLPASFSKTLPYFVFLSTGLRRADAFLSLCPLLLGFLSPAPTRPGALSRSLEQPRGWDGVSTGVPGVGSR